VSERIVVAGAGLAGSLMAVLLARRGYDVQVYERRGDMRREPVGRGRSINLALSTRGLHALGVAGLREQVLASGIPMHGRMIHSLDGGTELQRYSTDPGEHLNSVSRHDLNVLLLNEAEKAGVRIHFHEKCLGVEPGRLEVLNEETRAVRSVDAPRILGADGAYSAVRAWMQRRDRFDYHQNYLDWGYKELHIPPRGNGRHRIFTNALHIWPRHDFMLIALPNLDGSFTCTLFLPFEGPQSFAALKTDDDVLRFFTRQFPDAVAHMPTLVEDYRHNPVSSLVYIRCAPWHVEDRVALLGDACHAVVPFYGQGMNAAFEDCAALDECIDALAPDWQKVFETYAGMRKPNTDALADLSLRNFVEMRGRVVSPLYLAKKKADDVLHRLFPDHWSSLYTMVTFRRIPYAEAVERARRQDLALGLAAGAGGLLLAGLALRFTSRFR